MRLTVLTSLTVSRALRCFRARAGRVALVAVLLGVVVFVCVTARATRSQRWFARRRDSAPVLCTGRATFDDPEFLIWTFWDDDRTLSVLVSETIHAWKIWNPEHEVVLLTNNNVHCYLPDNSFETFRALPALRSDLIRLNVLKLYGGTWLDASVLLTEPLMTGPLPEFQGIYSEHYSNRPRDFPETWHMRAAAGSNFISQWLLLLQTVVYINGPHLTGLSRTHIYTPESTNSYYKIERTIGASAIFWSEYLVAYVAYTYAYQTDPGFRAVVVNANSYASEKVGYLLPWHLEWNMTEVNLVISRPFGEDPLHHWLQDTKMIKLSTSNVALGVSLADHQYDSYLGHCLRKVRNSAGLERSMFRLVIARYQEDVTWSDAYRGTRVMYDKGGKPNELPGWENDEVHYVENTGMECSGYLRYIIRNYDSLPEYVGFTQGALNEEHAWIRSDWGPGMFANMLEEARSGGGCSAPAVADAELNVDFGLHFDPMRPRDARYKLWPPSRFPNLAAWMAYHRWQPLGGNIYFYPSAFMVASRDRIRSTSKTTYRKLLDMVSHSHRPPEAHYMERTWWYLFNCPPPS